MYCDIYAVIYVRQNVRSAYVLSVRSLSARVRCARSAFVPVWDAIIEKYGRHATLFAAGVLKNICMNLHMNV